MKSVFNVLIVVFLVINFAFGAVDSNGIWHLAQDVRPGIFGSDEMVGNYKFESDLFIEDASLNVSTNTGRGIYSFSSDDDGVAGISSASGKSAIYGWGKSGAYSGYFEGGDVIVSTNLNVSGNLKLGSRISCGKLSTDGVGNVQCLADAVNDADYVIGNEYPVAGTGITVTTDRTVNVDTSTIATKAYVDAHNDADYVIGNEYPVAGTGITVTTDRTVNVNTAVIATRAYADSVGGGGTLDVTTVTGPDSACRGTSIATCPAGYKLLSGGSQWLSTCACSESNRFLVNNYPSGNSWVVWMECSTSRAYAICGRII